VIKITSKHLKHTALKERFPYSIGRKANDEMVTPHRWSKGQ